LFIKVKNPDVSIVPIMITNYAFESIYTRVEIEDILELKKIYSTVDIIVISVPSCENAGY